MLRLRRILCGLSCATYMHMLIGIGIGMLVAVSTWSSTPARGPHWGSGFGVWCLGVGPRGPGPAQHVPQGPRRQKPHKASPQGRMEASSKCGGRGGGSDIRARTEALLCGGCNSLRCNSLGFWVQRIYHDRQAGERSGHRRHRTLASRTRRGSSLPHRCAHLDEGLQQEE